MSNKGKHFLEEHRKKIGLSNKGKHRSEEFKRNISERAKLRVGDKNAFYGKHHSENTKKKISIKNRGKIPWQKQLGDNHPKVIEYRRKLKETGGKQNEGRKPWNFGLTKEDIRVYNNTTYFRENNPAKLDETKIKISKANKGKLMGDLNPAKRQENRIKITLGLKKAFMEGRKKPLLKEKNPMWKGGLSFEPYTTDWTNSLRNFVRKRDNYTCQSCLKEGNQVHHIDYNKKNCDLENLITLCKKCHSKTNAKRERWKKFFQRKSQIYKV